MIKQDLIAKSRINDAKLEKIIRYFVLPLDISLWYIWNILWNIRFWFDIAKNIKRPLFCWILLIMYEVILKLIMWNPNYVTSFHLKHTKNIFISEFLCIHFSTMPHFCHCTECLLLTWWCKWTDEKFLQLSGFF